MGLRVLGWSATGAAALVVMTALMGKAASVVPPAGLPGTPAVTGKQAPPAQVPVVRSDAVGALGALPPVALPPPAFDARAVRLNLGPRAD